MREYTQIIYLHNLLLKTISLQTVRFADFEAPIPGPTGDIIVAYLDVTVIGIPKEQNLLDISIPTLSDSTGDDIVARDVDGTITVKP